VFATSQGLKSWMGVLGFVPFLQKTYPQTIRTLPNRLKELSGRTLVFDGTLITQRLHFSPMPHRYKHVLGWYRMIQELKECDIQAICVFDGKERSIAKKRETERRRDLRKITAARGSIENHRSNRLKKLTTLLQACNNLAESKQEQASHGFRDIVADVRSIPISLPPADDFATVPDMLGASLDDPWGAMYESDIREALFQSPEGTEDTSRTVVHGQTSEDAFFEDSPFYVQRSLDLYTVAQQDSQQTYYDHVTDHLDIAFEPSLALSDPDHISSALATLYLDYRASIPQFTILPPSPRDTEEDSSTVYAMSKLQLQLVAEEGQVWEHINELIKSDSSQDEVKSVQFLEQKSAYMSQSYERRNNPPTAETYAESKSILLAMGVPCIQSTGPYEAEAVASSIVMNGYGDYVVSEDTDVLVYEAPLLRNITSSRDPLTIIFGSEVRTVLSLTRANYLDFVLLLGTDFSQRIKNIGPQRALKFIREYGSIERIVEHETQYSPRLPLPSYLKQIDAARLVFQSLPPVPDLELFEQREMNNNLVSELLQRYRLHKLVANDTSYTSSLLGSNYFGDNP